MAKPNSRKRRPRERNGISTSFLPEGNPPARTAYIAAWAGLCPGFGLLFGWIALVFGLLGRRYAYRDEKRRGLGHAFVSCILGTFEILCNAAGMACLYHAFA